MSKAKEALEHELRNRQRKNSALEALAVYIQNGDNIDTLIEMATADADWYGDLVARLSPSGRLPVIARRLRSAGINEEEFSSRVHAVLNLAHDKMIQPEERRVIITNLQNALDESRKTAPKAKRK